AARTRRRGGPARRGRRRAPSEPPVGLPPPHRKGAARVIATLLRVWSRSLRRDRVALAMTFILPIAFFSIFASVFGRQGFQATSRVRVLVVDENKSEASRSLIAALSREGGLHVMEQYRQRGA